VKNEYKEVPIIERLEIKLSGREEEELNSWIDHKKELIINDRTNFVSRHQKYLENWDDFVTYVRKGPWEGSSNLHMPLTHIMVKSYQSRFYNIFSQENAVQLVAREDSDSDKTDMLKFLRDWYVWDYINEYRGIRGFIREIFYDVVTVGYGIGMKTWQTKQRKVLDIDFNELNKEMADLGPQVGEVREEVLKNGGMETDEEYEKNKVSIAPYKEVEKIITVFDGSRVMSVPFENAYFPNHIPESNNMEYPAMIGVTTEMSLSDIYLKVKQKEWKKDRADRIRDEGTSSNTRESEVRQKRNQLTGYDDTNDNDKSMRNMEYLFCTYDIDGDGIDEEIIVTRSVKGVITKVNYLDRVSPSGYRPVFKFDCFTKPRQAYSRGVPEFMYPLNEEMDMLHNMQMDALALQTCPFGVYRSTSSLKNEPIRIAPGKFIPVDSTDDMRVMNFQTTATVLSSVEDRLWHYAGRQASVSELNQGQVPSMVGATRSTSGVVTLLQQMDKEFKMSVDQNADTLRKLEKMLMDDLDYRIDPALKMRVLGARIEDYVKEGDKDDFDIVTNALRSNGAFDHKISVADIIHSDEVRRSEAQILLQMLTAPSLAQQMGIIGPKALYKVYEDFLKAYGKECSQYIDKPDFTTKPLTLFQEIQICAQGGMPPMSMQDDHLVKAQQLPMFVQSAEFQEGMRIGIYTSDTIEAILSAAKKHAILAEQLQPKGLPNPSGENGQNFNDLMSNNAPQQGGNNVRGASQRSETSTASKETQGSGGNDQSGGERAPVEG
jgi:hypothetical protein